VIAEAEFPGNNLWTFHYMAFQCLVSFGIGVTEICLFRYQLVNTDSTIEYGNKFGSSILDTKHESLFLGQFFLVGVISPEMETV